VKELLLHRGEHGLLPLDLVLLFLHHDVALDGPALTLRGATEAARHRQLPPFQRQELHLLAGVERKPQRVLLDKKNLE
jgi:hypothetical protein